MYEAGNHDYLSRTGCRLERTRQAQRVGTGQDRRSEHYLGGEEEEEGRTRQCPRPCSPTLLPPLGIVLLYQRFVPPLSSHSVAQFYKKQGLLLFLNLPANTILPHNFSDQQSRMIPILDGRCLLRTVFSTKMFLRHHSLYTRCPIFPPHLVFLHPQHHQPSVMQT